MATPPVFFPRKYQGQRSLVSCSPWGRKELEMTEHTHTQNRKDLENMPTEISQNWKKNYL